MKKLTDEQLVADAIKLISKGYVKSPSALANWKSIHHERAKIIWNIATDRINEDKSECHP